MEFFHTASLSSLGTVALPQNSGNGLAVDSNGLHGYVRQPLDRLHLRSEFAISVDIEDAAGQRTGDSGVFQRHIRLHIQVKDHDVTPAEFKEVVAHFQRLDTDLNGVYKCFTSVCPSLSARMQHVETGLSRFRNAKPFYDNAAQALAPTTEELDARLRKIGLSDTDIAFVHAKVFFEIGHGYLHHDDRALDMFVGRLLKHPDYAEKIRAAVQPAFAELMRAIQGKRGAVLERSDVDQILRAAVATVATVEKGITIWVQNWTKETFDLPADYSLDWSSHFDRSSRKVPTQDTWNDVLLPELRSLKDKIVAERTERLIRFRGKCALSTGVALGAIFPAVGGWTFEMPQPPAKEQWRSDAAPTKPYDLNVEITDGAGGEDLILGLNIRGRWPGGYSPLHCRHRQPTQTIRVHGSTLTRQPIDRRSGRGLRLWPSCARAARPAC